IQRSYANGVTDEFVVPCVTCEGGRVQEGDTVIFMNFRPDRARQMTRIFVDDAFDGFERRYGRFPVHYVCMAEYDATMPNVEVAYPPVELKNVLGEYLSAHGKTQLRIAETEKYAHVTFFFNGGVEAPYEGEDRKVVPSPKVATYDLQPEMSEPGVTEECVQRIESGKYDVIILNFANCDMVGHTGVFDAAVKAVEAVDDGVGKVVDAVLRMGGVVFLTADHGNAEHMKNPDGTPFTAHTTNVVPFAVIGAGDVKLREGGCLADIAPTMMPYIGLDTPAEMTGKSIIVSE
ncbi:MAG TPA: 2,3-bisphosphoglycerate-independent phosphoglycerate mutase, partial [Candidatus Gemmiger stercoravium]|nr:2,3-bisphosphoglycerate-independent phosphoglycerate mutase [Candidatus Gemmiger stercoravium]